MENQINKLPNGDFEVSHEKFMAEMGKVVLMPYEFARDRDIEEKIANDKRGKVKEGDRAEGQSKQGSGERNSYVPLGKL